MLDLAFRTWLWLASAGVVAGSMLPPPWADVCHGLIGAISLAVTVKAVRRLGGSVGWRLLAVGAVLIALSPATSELHRLADPEIGPLTAGDAELVTGYLLFILGMRRVLSARTMARQVRAIGDALLVTLWIGFVTLAWSGPELSARLDGYPLLASLIYLPLSLAMVFLVLQLIFGSPSRSPSVSHLAAGITCTVVSELGFLAVAAGHPSFRRVGVAAATLGLVQLAAAIRHPTASELEQPIAGQQDPLSRARTFYLVFSLLAVAAALVVFPRPQPHLAVILSAIAVVTVANLVLIIGERERLIVRERQLRQSVTDIMRAREPGPILHLGGLALDRLLESKQFVDCDFLRLEQDRWLTAPDGLPSRFGHGADRLRVEAVVATTTQSWDEVPAELPGIDYLTRLVVPLSGAADHAEALVVEASPVLTTTEIEQINQLTSTVERALVAFDLQERSHQRRADQRFRLLVEDSSDIVALIEPESRRVRMVSPSIRRILGYREGHSVGAAVLDVVHPNDQPLVTALLDEAITRPQYTPVDIRVRHRDGHHHWFSLMVRDRTTEPDVGALVMNLRDIHDRKMAELSLAFSEQRYRGLVLNSKDVFAVLEADLTISYISPNVVRMLGHRAPDLVATSLSVVLTPDSARALAQLVATTDRVIQRENVELELVGQDGRTRRAEVTVSARSDNPADGFALTMTDITEQRRLEHDLRTQALYDALTGLPNRSTLHFELQQALQRLGPGEHLGLFHLDINEFKAVNESVGYEAGDELLVQVATRLRAHLRSRDVLARIGGNEFAMVIGHEHRHEVAGFATRVVELFDTPFVVADRPRRVNVTVGYDITADRWAVARDLMDNASVALGAARRDSASVAGQFEPIMKITATERFELSADLMGAIDRDELSVVYQPIIEMDSRKVRGVEALLRWNHPRRGPVSPAVFIPLAERSGLITELGRWVLTRACYQLLHWHRHVEGAATLGMSVNVSALQLEQAGEAEQLGRIVVDSGVAANRITIELTESTLIEDPTWIRSQLELLRGGGMRVAIDDFGTGAAGLGHLRDVPFNVVKIDKSYVEALSRSNEAQLLVRGVIELAHSLGAETVAEGIEEPGEFDLLRSLGCTLGQGFYLGRPMDPAQLEAWFAQGWTGAAPSLIAHVGDEGDEGA